MSFKILLFHRNNRNLSKNWRDSAIFDSILQFFIFFLHIFYYFVEIIVWTKSRFSNRYVCDSATFDSILQFYIFFLRVF